MIITLQNPQSKIKNILGFQDYNQNKKYEYSPYLLKIYCRRGITCIKNYLTSQIISVKNLDQQDEKFLVENWFKFENKEQAYLTFKRTVHSEEKYQLNQNKPFRDFDNLKTFIIFTSLNCNANCFYCYEKNFLNCGNNYLSIESANKIIELIKKSYKNDESKKIHLSWFGGEPLINSKIIDYICKKLQEEKINFFSTIISNGILFEKGKDYKKDWNLKSAQITVDGIYTEYEKIKQVPEGTFEKVITNIKFLLSQEIKINIRLNLTDSNLQELKKIVKYFKENIENKKFFNIYAHEIFDNEDNKKIYIDLNILQDYIEKFFPRQKVKNRQWSSHSCMTDKEDSICILPDGKISPCEHHIDKYWISDIDKNFYDIETDKLFIKLMDREECKFCPLRPTCIVSQMCASAGGQKCSEYRKWYLLNREKLWLTNFEKSKRRTKYMIERKMYANSEIYNMGTELLKHFGGDNADNLIFPIKFSFYFQKNMKAIVEAAQDIEAKRIEIIKKFGNATEEEPTNFIIPEDKLDEATKEVNELFELEQEIPVYMASLDSLGDITMTPAQVSAISFMIQEEE